MICEDMESQMGVCVRGVYHHIRILVDCGIIELIPNTATYRLVKPTTPVHKVLHNLTVACRD